MSISSEIERIQNAKNSLKTSINAKTDSTHQITNETIDEYANFVDSISTGGSGGGGDIDWSAIGYNSTPQSIVDEYNYSKNIYDNWDSTQTILKRKFRYDLELVIMPLVDTSKATNMASMFEGCTNLKTIPLLETSNVTMMTQMFYDCRYLTSISLLDTSNVSTFNLMFQGCINIEYIPVLNTTKMTSFNNMFNSCRNLTDTSLDNILQMCIGATSYTGTKTLAIAGFNSTNYPTSRIKALPHYQDFINAGWTIGY